MRAGAPAPNVVVVSPTLIKCNAPPSTPPMPGQPRHEVGLQLVSAANGAGVACGFTFTYVQQMHADANELELFHRIASSIERAHAAAGAVDPKAGAVPFLTVDEHGYSLSEYGGLLRKMAVDDDPAPTATASELQMQHQELATMLTRERLSLSIARRPAPETLLQRNILQGPEAEAMQAELAKEKRLSLSKSLMNRPLPEQLQDRNILRAPENETQQQQLAMKRKRLSDFLIERPTIDQLQGLIEDGNLSFSLDAALEESVAAAGLGERRMSDDGL